MSPQNSTGHSSQLGDTRVRQERRVEASTGSSRSYDVRTHRCGRIVSGESTRCGPSSGRLFSSCYHGGSVTSPENATPLLRTCQKTHDHLSEGGHLLTCPPPWNPLRTGGIYRQAHRSISTGFTITMFSEKKGTKRSQRRRLRSLLVYRTFHPQSPAPSSGNALKIKML